MPLSFHDEALRFLKLSAFFVTICHTTQRIFLLTQVLLDISACASFVILSGFTFQNFHSVDYFYCWQHCVRVQGPIIEAVTVFATMQHNSWLPKGLNLVLLFRVYHNNIFVSISSTSAASVYLGVVLNDDDDDGYNKNNV